MIYSIIYMKEIQVADRYSTSLFITSLTLTTATVLLIFPTVILLLRQSQNRDNILSIIQQFDTEWTLSYYENVIWNKNLSNRHFQKDPVTLLTEIGTVAIKEFDQVTIQTIIQGFENFFEKSLSNESKDKNNIEPQKLYFEFRTLLKNLFQIAAKERNENAMLRLVNCRFGLETKLIDNIQIINLTDFNNKYQGWDYNFDSEDFFERAIQFNEDEVCRRIIDCQRDFIGELIKKILVDRKFDYDFNDLMKNMDESHTIHNAISVCQKFLSTILNYKKYHLFQNISNFHTTIDLNIIGSENTRNTKIFLLNLNNNIKIDQFEKFIKYSDIKLIPSLFYPFSISTSQALTHVQSRIPFVTSLKAIDILFSMDKLNTMAINSLKAEMMFLSQNINENKINKELFELALSKFKQLRQSIKEKDTNIRKDVYLKLEKHLGYVFEHSKTTMPTETELISKVDEELKNFTFKKQFEKELREVGFLSDDSII